MKGFANIKNSCIEYLAALLIWCSIQPYFLWKVELLGLVIVIAFILLSFIRCKSISGVNIAFFLVVLLLFLIFAIRDGKNIFGITSVGLVCFILLFPSWYLCRIFNCFIKIYAALIIPSIVVYILVMFVGVSLPSQIIEPLNTLKDSDYIQYPFLVMINRLGAGTFRFMSYFDEPGVVGTISGVLLFIHGCQLKRWETYPILISGLFSLSLAFFLMLFANIILFQPLRTKVFFIALLSSLAIYFATDEVVGKLIFARLEIEDGELAGINRTTSSMDSFMKRFVDSDKFWFGYGNNYAQKVVNEGGASYKDLLVNYGLFGFLSLIIISMFGAIKRLGFSIDLLIYVTVWGAIIYQRPFIFNLIYFFLLYIPLFYLKDKQNKRLYYE